jgi:glycosyltransferase involved in cell wall biosynthesis
MGGIPYLVGTSADAAGWIVEPTVEAMSAGLKVAAAGAGSLVATARLRYERHFSPEVLVDRLLDIYREVAR